MRLFKKTMAVALASAMTIGMAGVASAAPVPAGTNVLAGLTQWTSFSVCTREDGGEWEEALKAIPQTKGVDYATEGYITATSTVSDFDFFVINSGWDGEYNKLTNELVNDNPWGMTATLENVPVEAGRNYTISFNISSTLKASKKDALGNKIGDITTKHILFKAYKPGNGDEALDLLSTSNITSDGYITLDSSKKESMKVSAVINVPKDYKKGNIGLKFALGALLKTYADEIGMSGYIHVNNFTVTANKQYTVNFVSQNKTMSTKYVNEGEKVDTFAAKRKGYTLVGYTANGASYNFNSVVPSDLTLVAQWKKTAAPAKVKIASVKSKSAKKAVVSLKKAKNVKGYAVQYSTNSKFKGAKQKTSKKTKIILKKLKSGSIVYVRAKAYTTDSADNTVFSKKWSAKKLVVVK